MKKIKTVAEWKAAISEIESRLKMTNDQIAIVVHDELCMQTKGEYGNCDCDTQKWVNSVEYTNLCRKLKLLLKTYHFCSCGQRAKAAHKHCCACGKILVDSPHKSCKNWRPELPFCPNCGKKSRFE